ncbi:MAG: endonuclease/exonuclease/phosphatase family protein [Candidatus Lokiarchaeota archaeon]|nr:endonuclease/exonuclease/phosphatase family protein [Candidatus Lokiarchaeota archaeon]
MAIGYKVFSSMWERLFQWFFPSGYLTVEFGWYYVLGALILSSCMILLRGKTMEKKQTYRIILLNLCLLAVTMFIPPLLGVYLGFLVCNEFLLLRSSREMPIARKIGIIVLNNVGILGLIGGTGIMIYFWRFVIAYMILGGFIAGILLFLIKPVRSFFVSLPTKLTSSTMKNITISSALLFILLGGMFITIGFIRPYIPAPSSYIPSGGMNVTLTTYNIRLGTGIEENEYDYWRYRKDELTSYIDTFDSDFICIQEAYYFQIRYLMQTLTSRTYKYIGAGRDDGVISGEHACILFDSLKYRVITGGNFWLSDYPFYPSQTWHGKFDKDRVVSWARFEEIATQEQVCVVSVHYDSGAEFREKANVLLNERVAEYSGDVPVIVAGDFNYNSSMSGWNFMENYGSKPLKSAYHLVNGPGPHLIDTFNGFELTYDSPTNMIDFIFVSSDILAMTCEVLQDTYTGPDGLQHYPSDHFPVIMQCLI